MNKNLVWYLLLLFLLMHQTISQIQGNSLTVVKHFSCVTYNWKRIVCRWDLATSNSTHLELLWQPVIRYTSWYRCPSMANDSCQWDVYDLAIDINRPIRIFLKQGDLTQSLTVRWNETVLPDQVFNLKAVPKSPQCATVEWEHNDYIHNKTFRIVYKSLSSRDKREIQFHSDNDRFKETACGLSPYTRYEIEVSCRPVRLGYWSPVRKVMVTTNKTVPASAPSLLEGGYSWKWSGIDNQVDLTIYWQPLEGHKWHGDTISYWANLNSSSQDILKKGSNFHVTFRVNVEPSYSVMVYSSNEIGPSTSHVIQVASYNESDFAYNLLAIKDKIHTQITWSVQVSVEVSKFTIFWCEHGIGHTCKAPPISKSVLNVNSSLMEHKYNLYGVPDATSYLFGVAYNSVSGPAGFVWSDCVFDSSKEFPLQLKVALTLTKSGVRAKWRHSSCRIPKLLDMIDYYTVQLCSDRHCWNSVEYKVTDDHAEFAISYDPICLRVFPNWNATYGKTASIECIANPSYNDILTKVLVVAGFFISILAIFGCCFFMRKLKRTAHKIRRPYEIEPPSIHENVNQSEGPKHRTGDPLLTNNNSNATEKSQVRDEYCSFSFIT